MILARRIIAFAGLPFLALITPFLFLPILARVAGADAWLAIAVGQSSGGFFALAVALGYNTVGPALVATALPEHRARLLATSLQARAVIWVPCAAAAVLVAAIVAPPGTRLEAGVMAFAASMTGLAGAWFMIGLGRASLIAIYEIAPRMVVTVIAAALVLSGHPVLWYPVLLVIAAVVSVGGFAVRTIGLGGVRGGTWSDVVEVFRSNRSSVITEVAGGAYNAMAVTLVGISATAAQAASYVSGDKLYRIGQYSVSALGNAMQGWAVERGTPEFGRRIRVSLLLHLALGLAGFTVFATLAPWLSGALFGDVVQIDQATAFGLGTSTLGIALGTTLGRITLVGMGARREFMTSALLAAAVGVPMILLLSAQFGAAGGAWGLASAEMLSVVVQSAWLVKLYRRAGGFVVSGETAPAQLRPTPPSS